MGDSGPYQNEAIDERRPIRAGHGLAKTLRLRSICSCLLLLQLSVTLPLQARPDKPCGSPSGFQLIQNLAPFVQRVHEEKKRVLSTELRNRIGSRPPLCRDKCNACHPCEPVQVPTPVSSSRSSKSDQQRPAPTKMHVDYSNYQPEGWKCKCGSGFFNP